MIYATGLMMGLLSSLHCIGMCGPIAMALPVPATSHRPTALIFYNAGRVMTYAALGVLFGLMGSVIMMAGMHQLLSMAFGVVLIVAAVAPFMGSGFSVPYLPWVQQRLRGMYASLMQHADMGAYFVLGMLNGLLPCGVVYLALAGAVATGGPAGGALYMALFGLGTAPAMFAVGYISRRLSASHRITFRRMTPVITIIMGCLLIMRGMDLGIPYLSPKLNAPKHVCCASHH